MQRSSVKVFIVYDHHSQFSSSQDFPPFASFFLRDVRFYDKKRRLRPRRSSRRSKERIEGRGRTKIRVDCKIVTTSLAAQLFRIRGAYKKARFPRPLLESYHLGPRVIIRFRELPGDSSNCRLKFNATARPSWPSLKPRNFSINAPRSSIHVVFWEYVIV